MVDFSSRVTKDSHFEVPKFSSVICCQGVSKSFICIGQHHMHTYWKIVCLLELLGRVGLLRKQKEQYQLRGSRRQRSLTCLQWESNKPCALALSQEIPIMLRASDSTESMRDRCDAWAPGNSGVEYSTERQTKALQTE